MLCGATGKAMFTEERAYEILDRLQYSGRKRKRTHHKTEHVGKVRRIRRGHFKRHERRAYRCEHCGMWHLTSQT